MKLIVYLSILFLFSNCSKPKTVLICGDHICVNKNEAKQYFEENLSLEVKIIDKKNNVEVDLVELNLKENSNINKKISITTKDKTNQKLKTLSKKEIANIKKNTKNKKKEKKFNKQNQIINDESDMIANNQININQNNVVDVCTIIEKCSIDEIAKFLLQQGKKKGFPDITKRQ